MNTSPMTETAVNPVAPPPPDTPISRRRILGYAALPVLLLGLLTAGIRLASDAAARRQADADAAEKRSFHTEMQRPGSRNPATPLPAYRPADKKTGIKMQKAITGQMDALAARDYARALSFSVSQMRQMPPATFRQIVRRGYAPMTERKRIAVSLPQVRTEPARAPGGGSVETGIATVTVTTRAGDTVTYGYLLVKETGTWRIGGVSLERPTPPDESSLPPPRQERSLPLSL